MTIPGVAKVQHYVPQFLLRKFGNGKKDQLHVFDKHTSRFFSSNAKNVASESRFYDFQIGEHKASLEPRLAELEGAAKPLLDRILEKDSASILSDPERELIATFLAVQFTRTKAFREQLVDLPRILEAHIRSQVSDHEDLSSISEFIDIPNENEIKIQTANFMMNAPKDFGPHFLNKDWLLVATTRKAPFIIGDHPLSLQNSMHMGSYGNLGLAVEGIEIYLPLSPVRALAMWCPSHRKIVLNNADKLRKLRSIAPHLARQKVSNPERIECLERAFLHGTPIQYSLENVRNFNALQVQYSERFIFSCLSEFSLAEEMINLHPTVRRGMRMSSG